MPGKTGRGSSPRVRGRRTRGRCRPGRGRAHPRGCGADTTAFTSHGAAAGSSPRVRGRLSLQISQLLLIRLIPAGAGQTVLIGVYEMSSRAHPRGCGADCGARASPVTHMGSSPRVRGRLGRNQSGKDEIGLIPAGAGQTPCLVRCRTSPRAHPRGCGADTMTSRAGAWWWGSSPRVRGRRVRRWFRA